MDLGTRKPGTDPRILLRLSEQFLQRRRFEDCRKFAHQAQQIDPKFPGVSEILSVADVLLASKHQTSTGTVHDWYSVLQINRYSEDSDLIKQRCNQLYELLNPSKNKLPFADEAFNIVCDAWYVLSNPVSKLEFDDLFRKLLDDDEQLKFWTACPYCYYLYEYPRVYLDHCLRCSNEECCRAFTCVEIDQPPVEVLKVGKYMCAGFLPVGFQNGYWNPFVPLNKPKADPVDDTDKFVNVSDDDDEDDNKQDDEIETKRDESLNVGGEDGCRNLFAPLNKLKADPADDTDKFVNVSDDDHDKQDDEIETKGDESLNIGDEGVHEDAGGLKMEVDVSTKIANVGRKKSVAKNTKKVTGAGNRVRKQGFGHPETTDDCVFF